MIFRVPYPEEPIYDFSDMHEYDDTLVVERAGFVPFQDRIALLEKSGDMLANYNRMLYDWDGEYQNLSDEDLDEVKRLEIFRKKNPDLSELSYAYQHFEEVIANRAAMVEAGFDKLQRNNASDADIEPLEASKGQVDDEPSPKPKEPKITASSASGEK